MGKLLPATWHDVTVFFFGVVLLGVGLADKWVFHSSFSSALDVAFVLAGPAGVGLNVAYQAGLSAEPAPHA